MIKIALTIAFAALGVLLSIAALLHFIYRVPRNRTAHTPSDFAMPCETFPLETARGKRLFSWFLATRPDAPVIIILHGWAASSELMLPLASPFHREGYNILLLDARNHGRSDSDGHSSLPRFAEDLGVAIDALHRNRARHNGKIILMGHSVGAGAVLYEASRRRDIAAVISLAAFAHPEILMRRQLGGYRLPGFLVSGILRYVQWIIGVSFDHIAPMHTSCRIECPVLLVHGEADSTVPIADAHAILGSCKKRELELLTIAGAGHDAVDKIEQHADSLIEFLHRHNCQTPRPTSPAAAATSRTLSGQGLPVEPG